MSTALLNTPQVEEEVIVSALESIPEHIRRHIRDITATSGLENNEESVEKIAGGWLEKLRLFDDRTVGLEMEEVDSLPEDNTDAVLALTWSGSLVSIGPDREGSGRVEYTSIGLRAVVPESAVSEEAVLDGPIEIDRSISFLTGPVRNTSPIHKIAVCSSRLDNEEQQEAVNSATQVLKDEFVAVNRTIIL